MNDPVGPFAVLVDAAQIVGEILHQLRDQLTVVRAHFLAFFLQDFLEFLQKLLRRLREVLDEVQGILDLMGDARGEFTKCRQLFAHDDLVLSFPQVCEHVLQLVVLGPQFLRQLLHQVQTLDLQRVAPKHLQGRGHVGHLVPAFDLDLALQFSAGHSPHAL